MLDFLYQADEAQRAPFGKHWCGPKVFEHGKEALIATYQKAEGGDGQSVDVYCCALPAMFYELKVKSEPNSIGKEQPAFSVSAGSGRVEMAKFAAHLAELIADGMINFQADD
jgi:hypothetical protein